MGEDDPQLRKDLLAAKGGFDAKMQATQAELEALWAKWDAGIDSNDSAAKATARDAMVALLNRRSYLRNLVRDVNETLEG
jgi:molecular chaperone HscB